MRNRRRIRFLRRVALGLAVAALAAPAAQAEISASVSGLDSAAPAANRVLHGDDKVIGGIEKPAAEAVVLHGDDKAGLPKPAYVPFVTDFPRTSPAPRGDSTLTGYRRALPQDYGIVPVEVVRSPSTFHWGDGLIGAGGALALLALLGGATLAARRVSRPASV